MARANRHYIPGCVWHITHRCHKKEFLLRFARDRQRWLQWLFEGKKRFGAWILNYAVTSNHMHLLIRDGREREVIPQTMQLIAGRTGQEYNQRKNRKGAFWEDRYHATAVEGDHHLIQCMVYMDLLGLVEDWREFLRGEDSGGEKELRRATKTGRPLVGHENLARIEKKTGRNLQKGKPGRKPPILGNK